MKYLPIRYQGHNSFRYIGHFYLSRVILQLFAKTCNAITEDSVIYGQDVNVTRTASTLEEGGAKTT